MVGSGTRAGWPIPRPFVEQWQGKPVTEIRQKMQIAFVGNAMGVPIIRANWFADYMAGEAPGEAKPFSHISDGVLIGGPNAAGIFHIGGPTTSIPR